MADDPTNLLLLGKRPRCALGVGFAMVPIFMLSCTSFVGDRLNRSMGRKCWRLWLVSRLRGDSYVGNHSCRYWRIDMGNALRLEFFGCVLRLTLTHR